MMIKNHELLYMLGNTDGFGAGESRKVIQGHRFWTAPGKGEDIISIVKTSESDFLTEPRIRNVQSKCEWRYDCSA